MGINYSARRLLDMGCLSHSAGFSLQKGLYAPRELFACRPFSYRGISSPPNFSGPEAPPSASFDYPPIEAKCSGSFSFSVTVISASMVSGLMR